MEVGNHGQKVGGRSSHLLPRLSIDRLITTDDGTIFKGTVFAVVSRDIEHHNAGHKLEGSRETARGFFTPVGDKCLRSLSPGNAKLQEDALDGEDGAAAICGGVLSTPEVQSLRTRVTSQDREIQLKKITGILPISKSSKKQNQDYEATLEENDELHRKVERLEEEHRRQEQTLMQELSKIHDEKDALERERDRLLQGAGGEATSSEQQADNSELRHLQAENAVLQKTLAATREKMEQEMAALQKKVKSAEDRDGAASPDLPDGTPSTGAFDAGRLAEVELRLETALEEKKMLQRDSEQNKNRLNAALTECRAEAEKWEKKAKQKQESLRQLQEEKDQMYRDHQSSISAMEASRNSELQRAMAQNAKIQAELTASSEELLAERSAVEELRTQLAEAQNQASSNSEEADRLVSSLRGEMASLEKDLGDKIKRQESANTGEIEELSGNLKQAQERAQRFERERDQALEALDKANKVADKRKTLMDSMAIEKQQAATNIQEKLAEQSQGYENRLQASQERISQLQHQSAHQRISQLQEQVSRLSKLEEEMKSLNRIQAKLAQAEEQRNKLSETLEKQKEEHDNEMLALKEEMETLQQTLDERNEQIQTLEQTVSDTESKIKISEKKANSLMKDICRQLQLERKQADRLQLSLNTVDSGPSPASALSFGTPETPHQKSRFEELFSPLTSGELFLSDAGAERNESPAPEDFEKRIACPVMTRRITFGRGYCNRLEDHLDIFDTSSPVFGNIWLKTPDAGILGCLYIWGLLERFVVLWLRKTFWAEWRFLQEDGDAIWISRVGLIGGYCVFLEGWLHIGSLIFLIIRTSPIAYEKNAHTSVWDTALTIRKLTNARVWNYHALIYEIFTRTEISAITVCVHQSVACNRDETPTSNKKNKEKQQQHQQHTTVQKKKDKQRKTEKPKQHR